MENILRLRLDVFSPHSFLSPAPAPFPFFYLRLLCIQIVWLKLLWLPLFFSTMISMHSLFHQISHQERFAHSDIFNAMVFFQQQQTPPPPPPPTKKKSGQEGGVTEKEREREQHCCLSSFCCWSDVTRDTVPFQSCGHHEIMHQHAQKSCVLYMILSSFFISQT